MSALLQRDDTDSCLSFKRLPRAFSLLELLVVVALFGLIGCLAVPGMSKTNSKSKAFQCLNNNRQLCTAWRMYAADSRDLLVYASDDGTGTQNPSNRYAWVQTHLDFNPGNRANWDPQVSIVPSPLWPYSGQRTAIWKCPSDRSTVVVAGVAKPRVRTMAMNFYLGGSAGGDGGWLFVPNPYKIYLKISEITPPSKIFVFLDMREDSTPLWGNFVASMRGYSPPTPPVYELQAFPGAAHENGCGFSFADGHAEIRRWLDRRTVPPLGSVPTSTTPSPNNRDVAWLQDHSTRSK